jgi:hypothetical protein
MNLKSFFKLSKIKIILTIIILLTFPVKYTLPLGVDVIDGSGDYASYSLPIISIVESFIGLINPVFDDYSFAFEDFIWKYIELFINSTFWINLLIAYPLACLMVYIYSLKRNEK